MTVTHRTTSPTALTEPARPDDPQRAARERLAAQRRQRAASTNLEALASLVTYYRTWARAA
jgi:hypothetical protein